MKVIIEQRHTEKSDYRDCDDCALCKAIRESYPSINLFSVHPKSIIIIDKGKERLLTFSPGFYSFDFYALQAEQIKTFEVNIDYPEYDQQADRIIEGVLAVEQDATAQGNKPEKLVSTATAIS